MSDFKIVLLRAAELVPHIDLFDPAITHEGDILLALFAAAQERMGSVNEAITMAWAVLHFMHHARRYEPSILDWFDDPFRTRDEVVAELRACAEAPGA